MSMIAVILLLMMAFMISKKSKRLRDQIDFKRGQTLMLTQDDQVIDIEELEEFERKLKAKEEQEEINNRFAIQRLIKDSVVQSASFLNRSFDKIKTDSSDGMGNGKKGNSSQKVSNGPNLLKKAQSLIFKDDEKKDGKRVKMENSSPLLKKEEAEEDSAPTTQFRNKTVNIRSSLS
mmetsp:Transcript_17740/g.30038  ORF Transcript_17740/g.30038 Transcript_17740/m.30038 type:complete len:176 (-) Transcript_17740:156-683(-)